MQSPKNAEDTYRPSFLLSGLRLTTLGFLLTSGLVLTSGCSEPSETQGGARLEDQLIVTKRSFVLGADRRWQMAPDKDGILLKNFGRLRIWIGTGSDEDLEIRFHAASSQSGVHFEALWDGAPLTEQAEPLAEIVIPAADLEEGLHLLELRRAFALEPASSRSQLPEFQSIVVEKGDTSWVFDRKSFREAREVGEVLELGGTGAEKVKRRGWLFVGPGEHAVDVDEGEGFSVTAVVENLTSSPATLRVTQGARSVAEVELPPLSTAPLRATNVAGAETLQFEVRGSDDLRLLLGELSTGRPRSDRPPVVVITLDTTRRDALTPYGAPRDRTPRLAELAETATVFDAAYATSPWTLPSHSSIFTGLLPSQHGAGVSESSLSSQRETLAELLGHEGYFAGGFAGGFLMSYEFGVGQGFDVYRDPDAFETPGDRLTTYVEEFLDSHGDRDLFLFVNYFDSHWRYEPPDDLALRYGLAELAEPLASEETWAKAFAGDGGAWKRLYTSEEAISPAGQAYLQAAYAAEISGLDRHVGRLLDGLKKRGLFDEALIIVVADHGELLAEDGSFIGHGYRLSDELVQIPLIVKWPGQTQGERIGHLVSQIDLFPTILSLVRGQEPAPAPRGPKATDLRALPRSSWTLAEEHAAHVHPLVGKRLLAEHLYRVQETSFRQIVWRKGTECSRRGRDAWQPATCQREASELQDRLESWLAAPSQQVDGALDAEAEEALSALGYL